MTVYYFGRSYFGASRTVHVSISKSRAYPALASLAKRRLIRAEFFSLSGSGYTWLLLARAIGDRRAIGAREGEDEGDEDAALAPREPGNPNASLACHTGGQCAMTTIGFPGIVKTNDRERTRTGRIHLIGCPVKNGTAGAGMCSIDRSIDPSISLRVFSSLLSFSNSPRKLSNYPIYQNRFLCPL